MANSLKIGLKVSGVDDLLEVLKQLPPKVEQDVIGAALAVPARKLAKAAREFIRMGTRGTGLLEKSIIFTVRKARKKGLIISLIGPRRGVFVINPQGEKVNATRYAHLIEFGHLNRDGSMTAARPWLRPAIKQAQYFVTADIAEGLRRGIASALKRIVKSNRKKGN